MIIVVGSSAETTNKSHTECLFAEHFDQFRHYTRVSQMFTLQPHHWVRLISWL
jgi:hypothetical protein